jgi:hypothetical protein
MLRSQDEIPLVFPILIVYDNDDRSSRHRFKRVFDSIQNHFDVLMIIVPKKPGAMQSGPRMPTLLRRVRGRKRRKKNAA